MNCLPEHLPPRWCDSMRLRRPCLFRFRSGRGLSEGEARSVAGDLVDANGTGKWECVVVQLDASAREWEFRFKPHHPQPPATRANVWRA